VIPHGCELMIASHNQVRSPLQAERMTSLRFLAGPIALAHRSVLHCAFSCRLLEDVSGPPRPQVPS